MKVFFVFLCVFFIGCAFPTLDHVILRPNTIIEITPLDYGFNYEEVMLNIDQNRQIIIWHVFSENPKALIIIIPGSDANKGLYCEGLSVFVPNNFDVILFDYEGFGSSPGELKLSNCMDDAYAVVKYALKHNMKTFIFSVSLGTPISARIASDYELNGIIFEGTLNLFKESELWLNQNNVDIPFFWHSANFWMYPQIPESYDIVKYIQNVNEPKLFQHSIEDEVTPYDGGVEIFNLAPEPKEFWQMIGSHGKMVRLEPELYKQHTLDWLNSVLAK